MNGRQWAYLGALLGGAVSVAANVAHSYVPPAHAPVHWRPHGGAVFGAVFWPVALLVAIEILARVAWPVGVRWHAVRWLGLVPVAVVAAVVSYRHMSGLLGFYGEDDLTKTIGPLAVDGLMVMATGALIATSGLRRSVPVPVPVEHEDLAVEIAPDAVTPVQLDVQDAAPEVMPAAQTGNGKVTRSADPVETARLYAEIREQRPGLRQSEYATALGMSERTLRNHLKATQETTP